MRVIIHIGQHKTGTTALQNSMLEDRERLLRHGVLYPDAGHDRTKSGDVMANHNGLFFAMEGNSGPRVGQSYDEIVAELRQEIARTAAHTVVISSEHAWLAADQAKFAPLEKLDEIIPGPKEIVAYLRRPDRYVESWDRQLLRMGINKISPLNSTARIEHLLGTCRLDYRRAVDVYLDRYGSIRLFDYEAIPNTVMHFYGEILDIEPPEGRPTDVNTSIPAVMAYLVLEHVAANGSLSPGQVQALLRFGEREHVDLLGAQNRQRILDFFEAQDRYLGSLADRPTFFDDLADLAKPQLDALTVDDANERYRDMFDALLSGPSILRLRQACIELEFVDRYDDARVLYNRSAEGLIAEDVAWFGADLESATDGRCVLADGVYRDLRADDATAAMAPADGRLLALAVRAARRGTAQLGGAARALRRRTP